MRDDSAVAVAYAQTHLQLLNQLRDHGYENKDIVVIDRAHAYARVLFTASYRASGKPFLCHLVGTASVLASLEVPAAVVAAGLLHAAYALGDFGAGWLGRSELKRDLVRRQMGDQIEDLVNRYTLHPWASDTPAELAERLEQGGEVDREVLLMRLANEVDDHLDLGVLYCRDATTRLLRVRRVREHAMELASRLNQPRLRGALETVFDQCLSAEVAENLRTAHDVTFAVPTISRTRWRLRRVWVAASSGKW